ncbi:type II restriction enzyme BsuBI (Endonuclease BsuBI)(R.BsuBI) [Treponema primitia ZAS-2]|uniref:Type II restriction enzyme BsuBI (Endonuclease BsuBI)(R.BsuBI) n=1 Tax=Treponema primitia (strain ATCC BAA-887 / DSM 12427 / ZAS-2) TaxID=545694 RepID=F5YK34_TREPZ|nr:type II restriction enzyme BsuBI (Endonuclease BsuBI)(R.BsuBI) [Treponema primitia ZAS-2]
MALLDIKPESKWEDAKTPLIGITPIMDYAKNNYDKDYAPNSRETFRRFSMHQLVEAGIALYNPDKPDRPVNSPHAVYQISAAAVLLIKHFGTKAFAPLLTDFKAKVGSLAERYQQVRNMAMIPVQISGDKFLG